MFERILVAVDGSEQGHRGARWGVELARGCDAHVDVLYVLDEGSGLLGGEKGDPKDRGREALGTVADLADEAGVTHETHLVEGDPPETIVRFADEHDADVVVLGRQGRSGLGERLLGSVTDRVLKGTDVPVLVVPDGATDEVAYRDVLVTTDGSEEAERAGPYAGDLARAFDATCHVLSVADVQAEAGAFDAGGVTDEFVERVEREGREAAERLAERIDNVEVRTAVVRGIAAEGIDEYAADQGIDLIVMASGGEGTITGRTLGSVTDRVIRRVETPVLIV